MGATTISTVDDGDSGDGISAPLTLDIDGDITTTDGINLVDIP